MEREMVTDIDNNDAGDYEPKEDTGSKHQHRHQHPSSLQQIQAGSPPHDLPVATVAASWSKTKKWTAISVASLVCFVVGMNSTAILSATDEIALRFNIDTTNTSGQFDSTTLLVTAWNAGAAIVPLFLLPAIEDLGLRRIYFPIYILFTIFVMVQAVAPNFTTLIVSRVLAGSCGGALQNAVDGIAADVWGSDVDSRALSMTVFIFALLGGVTIGPVIGGAIVRILSWRWILYIQLIIYGAVFPLIVTFLFDTRPTALKNDSRTTTEKIKRAFNETILRSSRMLLTEFPVASFTLWSAFSFGTVFMLTQSIPLVYSDLYGWEAWKTGIVQLAIFIGELLGVILCLVQDAIIYPRFGRRRRRRRQAQDTILHNDDDDHENEDENPEARLYTSIPSSLFGLTAGLLIYAWTSTATSTSASPSSSASTHSQAQSVGQSQPTHSWPLPSLGLLLIGAGIQVIVQAVSTYITDCYSAYANSAVSAIAFGENIFAAFLPLATRAMYRSSLGFAWASTLLGFVALGVSCAPVVLVIFGRKMRKSSRFAPGAGGGGRSGGGGGDGDGRGSGGDKAS